MELEAFEVAAAVVLESELVAAEFVEFEPVPELLEFVADLEFVGKIGAAASSEFGLAVGLVARQDFGQEQDFQWVYREYYQMELMEL